MPSSEADLKRHRFEWSFLVLNQDLPLEDKKTCRSGATAGQRN
jgi:hypothetical protein